MLNKLIAFSLRQRILVLLIGFALSVAGFIAFKNLPIDAFPDVSSTQVQVVIKSPGMTPEEVESRIVVPIEEELPYFVHSLNMRLLLLPWILLKVQIRIGRANR